MKDEKNEISNIKKRKKRFQKNTGKQEKVLKHRSLFDNLVSY